MMLEKIHIISDCDGIFTSANVACDEEGKRGKFFSVNDSLTVDFLQKQYADKFDLTVLTGDGGQGLAITQSRMDYMNIPVVNCANVYKYAYIKANYDIRKVVYIGDDIYDYAIFNECRYGATVCNAPQFLKERANYVSPYEGGKNGLTDIIFNILEEFGINYRSDLLTYIKNKQKEFDAK